MSGWVLVMEDDRSLPIAAYGPFDTLNEAVEFRRQLTSADLFKAVVIPLFPKEVT